MSLPLSQCPSALPVPSLTLTPSPVPPFSALCGFPPPAHVPSLQTTAPPSCSSRFVPCCPLPRPHASSVTPPAPSASGGGGQGPMALVGGHTAPVGYHSIFAGHRLFLRKSSRTALQPTSATRAPRRSWWWARGLLVLQRLWAEAGRAQPQPSSHCPCTGDSKHAPESAVARDLGWGWGDQQEIHRALFSQWYVWCCKVLKVLKRGSKKVWAGLKWEKAGKRHCQVQRTRLGTATG